MAFNLAKLFVTVGADDAPLNRSLGGIKSKLAGLAATRFNLPGGGLLGALGLGAGLAGITKMIQGAGSLAETMSKVQDTFGKATGQVTDYANHMATAFGVPKRELLDAASMFGLIAQGMGETEEASAKLAIQMSQLAIDGASKFDATVPEALEKIRAGLTGESEPLKAWGVLMDEDAVKARGLTLGLQKQGKELDNHGKLMARVSIISEKFRKAQGDLERTAGSANNQTKTFSGAMQNLADTIGGSMLPAYTSLVVLMNDVGRDMQRAAEDGSGAWTAFFDTFREGVDYAGAIYRNLGTIFERTGVTVAETFTHAWEYFEWGARVGVSALMNLGDNFGEFAYAVLQAAINLKDDLVIIFKELWDYVASGFKDPIEFRLKPILDGVQIVPRAFVMPKLNLTDFSDQIAAIDDRMNAAEKKRGDARFDAEQAAKAANRPAPVALGDKQKPEKKLLTDIDAYSKEVTEAALNSKGKTDGEIFADECAKIRERFDKKCDQIIAQLKKRNPALYADD